MALWEVKQRLGASGIDPDMRTTCLAITDLLSKIAVGAGYHLSLPFFAKQLGDEHQTRLPAALSILCTMDSPLLSMHGYLDLNEGQHHLTDEEFHSLLQSGVLANPFTGEPMPKPLEHVRVFYSVKDEARDEY